VGRLTLENEFLKRGLQHSLNQSHRNGRSSPGLSPSSIVLGKDSVPELHELREVQSHLQKKGYNAQLVKDIPDISEMSNEEKVRFWGLACRFCVMVDRIPAGHVAEYMILREQRSILVVLRPVKSGSTYMIGDDALVDVNHIRIFSFDRTPLDMLDEAIEWAEKTAQERAKAYDAAYPWRHKQMQSSTGKPVELCPSGY
jgi:hypothetical protein